MMHPFEKAFKDSLLPEFRLYHLAESIEIDQIEKFLRSEVNKISQDFFDLKSIGDLRWLVPWIFEK
ncbi:MAG: hypothetical protein ACMUEM_01065 [Flavobacteriales bacterium AspAUS03]